MSTPENEAFLEQAKTAAVEAGLTESEAEAMAEEALKNYDGPEPVED